MSSINFSPDVNLYFNENLNKYFQYLSWRCCVLKKENIIESYKYQNEMFVLKFKSHGREVTKKFNSDIQLYELFPDFYN